VVFCAPEGLLDRVTIEFDSEDGHPKLFREYLHYQLGKNWSDIIQAGGATLAQTYSKLTGRSDAFSSFATLLQSRFPQGTPSGLQNDNPFPIG